MKLLLKQGRRIISIALVFMLVLTLVPAVPAYAASVAIDAANFPDEIFRGYVKSNFDTDNDSSLSDAELAAVTEINVNDLEIADIKGVEHFKALTKLWCWGYKHTKKLTTLDISQNVNLVELSCSFNELTELNLSKNTKLQILWCYDNKLTKLDVTANTELVELNYFNNKISKIDLSKNTELQKLYCSDNKISSIDISKNTKLKELSCGGNYFNTIDLSNQKDLELFNCYDGRLTSIDVSNNAKLKKLYVDGNELLALDVTNNPLLESLDYSFIRNPSWTIDLSKNPNLKWISCEYSEQKTLNLKDNKKLTAIACYGNKLTELDLSANTDITSLNCEGNALTSLNLSKNTKIVSNDDINCTGQIRYVYPISGKLNFSELPAGFDKAKVSNVTGGSITGNAFEFTGDSLSYKYNTGLTVSGNTVFLETTLKIPSGEFHDVKVRDDGNGSASADKTKAKYGEEITLIATPKPGYRLKQWKVLVSGTPEVFQNKFTMPDNYVAYEAVFERFEYFITVEPGLNGSAAASHVTAAPDTTITLTASPDAGYKFKEWEITSGGVTVNSDNTFDMPHNDVSIKPIFEKIIVSAEEHTITTQNDGNGTLTSDKSSAAVNEKVTLTVTPNPGYMFSKWKTTPAGLEINSENQFTMPNENVLIKAIFAEKPKYDITVKSDGNGSAKADSEKAYEGKTVTLTTTPNQGYKFKEWKIISPEGLVITNNRFTMLAEAVEVEAIFEKSSVVTPPSGGIPGGIVLPPADASEEVTTAKGEAVKAIDEALSAQTFSGDEQKKADEIKKDFEAKLEKAETVEEVKKLREEALAAIDKLWSDEELSLKEKVEAVSKADLIAKTKVSSTKGGKRAIRISWNKIEGLDFDGYEIYRSTNKTKFGKTPVKTSEGTKTSYLNTKNLRKGKTYYYKLKAFKMINGEKVYTNFSTKTWKTPKR